MSIPFLFILGCLAVFRLSELFVLDNGPFGVFRKLRNLFPEGSNLDDLLECYYCASGWFAIFVTSLTHAVVLFTWPVAVLWWLAIWGGAVAIYRVVPCRK
jgi:hypothetical protein